MLDLLRQPSDEIFGKMVNISIEDDCQETAATIEAELLEALSNTLPQARNSRFLVAARDDQGKLLGGLTANTSYGWLLIKTLWVDSTARGQGIGVELVHIAEKRALEAGCHAAWLDTSNPDAMGFYSNCGYESFGELANLPGQYPETHHRWFMRKSLKD